ncbi:MAG: ferric reductase-like transmembrane domain-containing protein [Acidimicrobiales bacterium]
MTSQLWWYLARSSGIVAWALVTASVVWGLLLSTRLMGSRPRPAWLLDLHRFLGGLAVVFTGVHLAGLVLDTYVDFGIVQLLVPFAADYRPGAVAWGIVALYLLAAIEITSMLRRRIPRRVWRATHLLSFPLYLLATVHGLTAGTDTGTPLRVTMAASLVVVFALAAARIDQSSHPAPRPTRVPTAPRSGDRGGDRIPAGGWPAGPNPVTVPLTAPAVVPVPTGAPSRPPVTVPPR